MRKEIANSSVNDRKKQQENGEYAKNRVNIWGTEEDGIYVGKREEKGQT